MNRLRILLLCVIVLAMCGCTKNKSARSVVVPEKPLLVCATFYPLYIQLLNITRNVPGVSLSLLAPANTGCLHDYQLTTKDMRTLESCDILVVNGAGMEDFLDKAISLVSSEKTVVASEGFSLVDNNPHVWVSPRGASYQTSRIAEGLSRLDSTHSDLYAQNSELYLRQLSALSDSMHSALDRYAGASIITFHEAFTYFASEFGLNIVAVIEREAGTEPSAKDLASLVALIRRSQSMHSMVALFAEPDYASSAARVIASETGLSVGELDPAVTGPLEPGAYLAAMERNTAVLEQFLGAP
ncbi:MAG: zinc ABC transporter substrate-binding protein [Treponema sp.]|nr:zinc ABC transporter substrate-binding protein [Treponema sp.]